MSNCDECGATAIEFLCRRCRRDVLKTHMRRPMETASFCGSMANVLDYFEDVTCGDCRVRFDDYRAKVKRDAARTIMRFGSKKHR